MNSFSFDFYNRNYTQRVEIAAAVAAIAAGVLVYVGDDSVLTVVTNDTDAVYLDNLYLLAEDVAIGALYFVGYPIRKDDWIAGTYLGKDITVVTGEDVSVHDGFIIPAEDLDAGEVLFDVVKIGDLVAHSSESLSINSASASSLTAGDRVSVNASDIIAANSTAGTYILAANYAANASVASVVTYKAPCVVKLI